jgi:hypothetical protein
MKLHLFNLLNVPLLSLSAAIAALFSKYICSDVEYLIWLFIAIALDLITGVAKVWAKDGYKAITSKGLRGTVLKIIEYGALLIITNVLTNFTINGEVIAPFGFIMYWAFMMLILIEIKSVYENIVIMNPRLDFINKIIDKINTATKSDIPASQEDTAPKP